MAGHGYEEYGYPGQSAGQGYEAGSYTESGYANQAYHGYGDQRYQEQGYPETGAAAYPDDTRPTRTRGTANTATAARTTRPRATPAPIRIRGTARSATAGRSSPTTAGRPAPGSPAPRSPPPAGQPQADQYPAASTRTRTGDDREPSGHLLVPLRTDPPRAGNRGGAAGVTRYSRCGCVPGPHLLPSRNTVRLEPCCAFRREATSAPVRDEGPAGLPAGPSFRWVRPVAAASAPGRLACPTCRPGPPRESSVLRRAGSDRRPR